MCSRYSSLYYHDNQFDNNICTKKKKTINWWHKKMWQHLSNKSLPISFLNVWNCLTIEGIKVTSMIYVYVSFSLVGGKASRDLQTTGTKFTWRGTRCQHRNSTEDRRSWLCICHVLYWARNLSSACPVLNRSGPSVWKMASVIHHAGLINTWASYNVEGTRHWK